MKAKKANARFNKLIRPRTVCMMFLSLFSGVEGALRGDSRARGHHLREHYPPDAFWLDLSMVIMLTDGYGSYPGRALAQVCQSARHHCGGKPIRFHTVQFPSNGSRGQVMEQIAESVRQQAAGDDFAAKSSFLHSIDGTLDHTNLNARAPWSFFGETKAPHQRSQCATCSSLSSVVQACMFN